MMSTSSVGSREEKVRLLSKNELFRDLAHEHLERIERSIAMTTCGRGRVFYTPDQTGEVLFILKKGRVNLYRITEEGRKLVTASVEAGSVFGEMSLIGQGMQDSYAEATEDCTICVMSRRDVELLITRYPAVGVRILEHMGQRLRAAEERLAEVAYKSIPARIAGTLLRLAGREPRTLRLTHQDIAEMVGTYRETVTRVLNEMRAGGIVDLHRMEVAIRDVARLEEIASEDRRSEE